MTRPLTAKNRPPQTLALPGFVVFSILKLQGLSPSDNSARSPEVRCYGRLALTFERVQMTPADPGFDRPTTRSSARGALHLNAFNWLATLAAQPLPPHSTTRPARYLNAFKRPAARCENPPSALPFERVQMTRRWYRPRSAVHRPRRHPILLTLTGGLPMPPPQ